MRILALIPFISVFAVFAVFAVAARLSDAVTPLLLR